MTKHFPRDAERLVRLSLALSKSSNHTEDRFWEVRIASILEKVFRHHHQTLLDSALEQLQPNHPDAYSILADLAEAQSASQALADNTQAWDAILIAVPILVWTRYTIPSGPLKPDIANTLLRHLQTHVLATGTRCAMAPYLYSIDQLPCHHADTYHYTQQLAQTALTEKETRLNPDDLPPASPLLADPRFLLAVAIAPAGNALFCWQEEEGQRITRDACLQQWNDQAGASLALALSGCEFECLLPDAYYSACRHADERIRPYTISVAVRYLEETLAVDACELRAVIAEFGKYHLDEYRISFTRRGNNEVLYGVVWPLYGQENHSAEAEEEVVVNNTYETIASLLKEAGIADIRHHCRRFEPEYCDDCSDPLYANPFGETVHAKMPEEATLVQPRFH
jgi:hypothetical protein